MHPIATDLFCLLSSPTTRDIYSSLLVVQETFLNPSIRFTPVPLSTSQSNLLQYRTMCTWQREYLLQGRLSPSHSPFLMYSFRRVKIEKMYKNKDQNHTQGLLSIQRHTLFGPPFRNG